VQQICKQCSAAFEITDADLAFYDTVSPVYNGQKYAIPPPTLCLICRMQRRSAWRNERSLHARTCDRCDKKIITLYHPSAPFPVYCHTCWWSDQWEPKDYGQDLDLNRPFLEQFFEVNHRTPHLAMMNDNGVNSENCEYTTDFSFGKNCYMTVGSWFVEDCYYCAAPCTRSKFLVDCYFMADSEFCYECLDSRRLYNCRYLRNCESCHDCVFGYDLKGCSDCVGCYGLRQKQFCWFNEQLTEEEYKKRLSAFDVGSCKVVEEMKIRFKQEILKLPRRGMQLVNCEDCDGDYLNGCHDTHDSYLIFDAQHCRYCDKGEGQVSSYDLLHTGTCEYCYEGLTPDNSYMTLFSMWTWYTRFCRYSDNCHHSEHLFGCSSMKQSKFCILNKQYTEEEYMALAPRIIERMQMDGEWGEMFPISASPFGYNETMAQDYIPLTEDETTAQEWKWIEPQSEDKDGTSAEELPDNIDDASDALLSTPVRCMRSGRVFRMIKQEIDFYRQHRIPLPRLHPTERHRDRFRSHNFPRLHNRHCMNCQKPMRTTYAPDRPEIIYCDECYLKTVY
jgi:hypothetical protein